MIGIIEISNTLELDMVVNRADGNQFQLSDLIVQQWNNLDQELKKHKKLKEEAKKNGYTLAQWKKKVENDK